MVSIYTMNGVRGHRCGRERGRFSDRGRLNGGGCGRGRGRGGGNNKVINGVEISDPTRLFTKK